MRKLEWNEISIQKMFCRFLASSNSVFWQGKCARAETKRNFRYRVFFRPTFRKIDENPVFGPYEWLSFADRYFRISHQLENFMRKLEWNEISIQKMFCCFLACSNSVLWQGKCACPETKRNFRSSIFSAHIFFEKLMKSSSRDLMSG